MVGKLEKWQIGTAGKKILFDMKIMVLNIHRRNISDRATHVRKDFIRHAILRFLKMKFYVIFVLYDLVVLEFFVVINHEIEKSLSGF